MSLDVNDPALKPIGADPPYDDWPLIYRDDFSWRARPGVFTLTVAHADRGVFDRYLTGGPHMRSHP